MVHILLSLRLESTANKREHWTVRHKRTKRERRDVALALRAEGGQRMGNPSTPAIITILRIAPRALDMGDNLPMACKGVRDGVADWMMTQDNNPLLTWRYAQRRGKPREYGVEITIEDQKP